MPARSEPSPSTVPAAPARPAELRPLLRLAAPVVAAELGWMAMWLVDTMIVGRLSAEAIGAVSVGGGVFFAVAIFGMGVLLGLDFLVGRAHGAGRPADAHAGLVAGVYTSVVATAGLTVVVAGLVRLLPRVGLQPAIVADASGYLIASTASLLPLLLFATLRRYLQALGATLPILAAILVANVVNAVAVWALVFGRLGAPALGAVGAGWATAAARCVLLAVLAAYLVARERRRPSGLARAPRRPDAALMRRLARLGIPAALQLVLEVGVFTVATLLAGTLDPTALAAHQLALNAAALSFMVPLGVASAGAVRVAQALGRDDAAGATQAGWTALGVAAAFMSVAAAAFLLVPTVIMRVFTTDPAVIAAGASLLAVAAAFQLFDGIQVVATGILRGTGDTRTPMVANLVGHWVLGLPVGWLLAFRAGWGVVGIWTGLTLGLVAVAAALLAAWMRRARALVAPAAGATVSAGA